MHILSERQRSLSFYQSLPSFTQEWDMIASILEANPEIERRVWEDLTADTKSGRKKPTGAKGMPAEQVVRFAVVKMKERLSYRSLQARVADSICVRGFCLVGPEAVPGFASKANAREARAQGVTDFESFQAYVQLAVLAFNLQTLARHLLA
jgi:hypothetical protein